MKTFFSFLILISSGLAMANAVCLPIAKQTALDHAYRNSQNNAGSGEPCEVTSWKLIPPKMGVNTVERKYEISVKCAVAKEDFNFFVSVRPVSSGKCIVNSSHLSK